MVNHLADILVLLIRLTSCDDKGKPTTNTFLKYTHTPLMIEVVSKKHPGKLLFDIASTHRVVGPLI